MDQGLVEAIYGTVGGCDRRKRRMTYKSDGLISHKSLSQYTSSMISLPPSWYRLEASCCDEDDPDDPELGLMTSAIALYQHKIRMLVVLMYDKGYRKFTGRSAMISSRLRSIVESACQTRQRMQKLIVKLKYDHEQSCGGRDDWLCVENRLQGIRDLSYAAGKHCCFSGEGGSSSVPAVPAKSRDLRLFTKLIYLQPSVNYTTWLCYIFQLPWSPELQ